MKTEPIPADCFPPEHVVEALLAGPTINADGRITEGLYAGMTPAEVIADRDAYRRACRE